MIRNRVHLIVIVIRILITREVIRVREVSRMLMRGEVSRLNKKGGLRPNVHCILLKIPTSPVACPAITQ